MEEAAPAGAGSAILGRGGFIFGPPRARPTEPSSSHTSWDFRSPWFHKSALALDKLS